MADSFVTFQQYYDLEQINASVETLKEYGIECVIENDSSTFDTTFANNELSKVYRLKLKPSDFARANRIFEELFQIQINSVAPDYYLFGFSDEELFEIIAKPDEWGKLDYVLAQKILKDRGKEVTQDSIDNLKNKRLKDLSKTDKDASTWIIVGYLLAFLGWVAMIIGAAALLMGLIIATHKKTLPDGNGVYTYIGKDRKHGWIILVIGLITFAFGVLRKYSVLEIYFNPYF